MHTQSAVHTRSGVAISGLDTAAFTVPTDGHETDGTFGWDSTTIIVVEIQAGDELGLGYSYQSSGAIDVIEQQLKPAVLDRDPLDVPAIAAAMLAAIRNTGNRGLCAGAVAAVDIALWDLKAKLLGVSLCDLLGRCRDQVEGYGSGGFISYDEPQMAEQLEGWLRQGFKKMKIKVGRDLDRDRARAADARRVIGDAAELYVDANGAYTRKQALQAAEVYSEVADISWFEEPVTSDDIAGLRLLRDHSPARIEIAAGEYADADYDFRRFLDADAVDVLQADATRCRGISGFMRADALCAAHGLELSAHTAPTVHLHACCSARSVRDLEYFHDHVRIESMLFDGVVEPKDGMLKPDRDRPGLGVEFRWSDAENYRV